MIVIETADAVSACASSSSPLSIISNYQNYSNLGYARGLLSDYQENMVSSAVGLANMAAGGGMVPAAAARSSGVNGIGGDVAIEQPLPHYQPLPRHEPPVAGIGDHHYSGPPRGKPAELSAEQLAELNKAMQEMVAGQQIAEITRLFGQNHRDMISARQPTTLPEFAPKTSGPGMS